MRRSEAGTIEQARLIAHTDSTEGTYSQQPCSDKQQCREMARIHNHSTISKQKRYPTKTDTRQHLKQFYLVGQAPPTDIYTKPKEKGSRDFPARVVHLATAASSPSGVVPRPARAARLSRRTPDSSDGVFGGAVRAAPLSRCGRGRDLAGAPLRVTLGKTLSRFEPPPTIMNPMTILTSHYQRRRDLH